MNGDTMKVLITGMTALQCKLRTPLKFHGIGEMLGDAAHLAQHEVDQRAIALGEDLSQYDVLMLGISPLGSISARRLYIVLDTILRARSMGCKLVFFVDDWRVAQIGSSINTIVNKPMNLVNGAIKRPNTRLNGDWATENLDYLMVAVNALQSRPWPTTIVPVHGFARAPHLPETNPLRKFLPSRRLAGIDITPFAQTYEDLPKAPPAERRRVWVNASLSDDTPWLSKLGFTWPIEATAKRLSKTTSRITVNLIDRRPEHEIIRYYGGVWGVLSHPYKEHVGSGYWRYRFIQSAAMGTVMVCDPQEMDNMVPYTYGPAQLETFTDDQLAAVAAMQRDALWSQAATREETVAAVNDALMEAT